MDPLGQRRAQIAAQWHAYYAGGINVRVATPSLRRRQVAERWDAYYARGPENMRREPLREDDGATAAARRKIHNQLVTDAGLLLWFARKARGPRVTQKYRCGKCDECLVGDCGYCASCRDKPKFGGRGLRKQACLTRRCVYVEKCAELSTRDVKS
jgi:hypothetical protein